ncbi:ty3-gypsy retrotransposon protein [Tanacetum coccineum]
MNTIFEPYLRKFVLVFFDDILVYSSTWSAHLQHLSLVFQALSTHSLFAKLSKYAFGVAQIEYRGNVISDSGVATDPMKIKAIVEWPSPVTLKQLRGVENKVADALSRVHSGELLSLLLTSVDSQLLDSIKATWNSDLVLHKLISELQLNPSSHSRYRWTGKELRRNNKLVIGNDTTLKQKLLHWMHNSPQGGHSGISATLKRIQILFYWPKLRTDVQTYIKECEVCQKCKADLAASPGLLQPLPIPKAIWEDIAMDFIEGLPISKGKSVILVVIDRLTYHPQSDGQSEVLNRCLEGYLRCMCFTKPNDWVNWLPLAEYMYNTSFHTVTKHTPFEIVYGQKPPLHLPYLPGESKVEALDRSLQAREETIQQLKENLRHVAYTLQLPPNYAIHPTFHVSLLKPHHGILPASSTLPSTHQRDHTSKFPAKVLEIRTVKKNNAAHVEWLVQWKDQTAEEATWESAASIDTLYPNFYPWGQVSS